MPSVGTMTSMINHIPQSYTKTMYHVPRINYVPNDVPQPSTKECASYICHHSLSVYLNHVPTSQKCPYNNHDIYQTRYKGIITSLNHVAKMYLKPCAPNMSQHIYTMYQEMYLNHVPYHSWYSSSIYHTTNHIPSVQDVPQGIYQKSLGHASSMCQTLKYASLKTHRITYLYIS